MSHHIYKTEAIIIGSRNSGESNRILFLLTEELGFIAAISQGVRNLKSKLRYSLQDFNMINVELVRGKEIWRVTSALATKGYSKSFLKNEHKIKTTARIFSVLRRLMHGESKNKTLFNEVSGFLKFMDKTDLSKDDTLLLEILINLRILHCLGYGSDKAPIKKFLSSDLSVQIIHSLGDFKKEAVTEVNRALRESHL